MHENGANKGQWKDVLGEKHSFLLLSRIFVQLLYTGGVDKFGLDLSAFGTLYFSTVMD